MDVGVEFMKIYDSVPCIHSKRLLYNNKKGHQIATYKKLVNTKNLRICLTCYVNRALGIWWCCKLSVNITICLWFDGWIQIKFQQSGVPIWDLSSKRIANLCNLNRIVDEAKKWWFEGRSIWPWSEYWIALVQILNNIGPFLSY